MDIFDSLQNFAKRFSLLFIGLATGIVLTLFNKTFAIVLLVLLGLIALVIFGWPILHSYLDRDKDSPEQMASEQLDE